MAFQLTFPTLLGVIIGGVAFIFCLAAAIVVISLRFKHRKLLAKSDAAGERRQCRRHGAQLSITDEDVAHIPGIGTAIRKSLSKDYTHESAYVTAEGQCGEEKLLSALGPTSTVSSMGAPNKDRSPTTNPLPQPWPPANRLTRAKRPPRIDLQPSAILPLAKATRGRDISLIEQTCRRSLNLILKRESGGKKIPSFTYDSQGFPRASPDLISFPSPDLKPRPLFHEQLRSTSHGMISGLSDDRILARRSTLLNSLKPLGGPNIPRSTSLTDQEPGTAPEGPIPPLPAEAVAARRQGSMSNFSSRQSLAGTIRNNTSATWEAKKTKPIRGEMGASSIKLIPPSPDENIWKDGDPSKQNFPRLNEAINGQSVSATGSQTSTLKAPLDFHKSERGSALESLPRSNSSGLSESLLNRGWSRPASGSSTAKDASRTPTKGKTPVCISPGSHISIFDFGLPTNLNNSDATNNQSALHGVQIRQRSPSVLQVIAGNKQNPKVYSHGKNSSSITTENPFPWKSNDLVKQPINKKGIGGTVIDERHASSNIPARTHEGPTQSSPSLTTTVETDGVRPFRSPGSAQSLCGRRVDPPAFRPPSIPTFDPQLTPTRHNNIGAARSTNPSPYFQTLAKLTGYEDSDSSPGSVISTPTHKPTQKRGLSSTNPNRQGAIFDNPSKIAQWQLASQHPNLSLGLRDTSVSPQRASVFRLTTQLSPHTPTKDRNKSKDPEKSQPQSLLYRFPFPPSPTRTSKSRKRPSKSQSQPIIHRPRLTPLPAHRSSRHPSSPTQTSTATFFASGSPGDQVRQSVIALRRMNSEVDDGDGVSSGAGRAHKRYLSLGEADSVIAPQGNLADNTPGSGPGPGSAGAAVGPAISRETAGRERARPEGPRTMADITKEAMSGRDKECIKDAEAPPPSTLARQRETTSHVKAAAIKGPRAMPGWIKDHEYENGNGDGVLVLPLLLEP